MAIGFHQLVFFGLIIAELVLVFSIASKVNRMSAATATALFVIYSALSQPAGLDGAVVRKGAILGALSLYLDFINLFLMLLRIFGGSRD
jgi:hypothetical protein